MRISPLSQTQTPLARAAIVLLSDHMMRRHNDDDIVELIMNSTDGHRWEYAIPFSRATGRYSFEEIDVVELDFGEDVRNQISEELDELIEKLLDE